ncbi:hypothetical protein BH10PSE14_BH10PSE14_06390 [soil metagenome]
MDTVPDIIEELGGATVISNETGVPLTTVHSWKRARFVPRWRVPTLVSLAQRLGKPITEASFPVTRPDAATVVICTSCELRAEDPQVASCTRTDCPMHAREEREAA